MLNFLRSLFAPRPATPPSYESLPKPWEPDRQSIYGFLKSHQREGDQPLPEAASVLPDEEVLKAKSGSSLSWAAGALDGVLGHHYGDSDQSDLDALSVALCMAVLEPSRESVKQLYELIANDKVLGIVDPLLNRIRETKSLPPQQLYLFAMWLAMESPDRGAVKLGISLLGLFVPQPNTSQDLLMTMGLHDEFTLYALIALGNADDYEDRWWSLAKRVTGWGRIHLVERLTSTKRTDIQDWLLREGYSNQVLIEYLAYPCAVGGNLLAALQPEHVDDALLLGASDILQALFNGGPALSINDYADGAAVVQRYLDHLRRTSIQRVEPILAVRAIVDFLNDQQEWDELESHGWTADVRQSIADTANTILAMEHWGTIVDKQLLATEERWFDLAAGAAEALGRDPWEQRYARQASGQGEQWYYLMRTDDASRAERVVDLAAKQFDLGAIATGPASANGFEPEYRSHDRLDFVLQALDRFPGIGWNLLDVGLRSPVIRNRYTAIRVLAEWGEPVWPASAKPALEAALAIEPDSGLKQNLENVLAGRMME